MRQLVQIRSLIYSNSEVNCPLKAAYREHFLFQTLRIAPSQAVSSIFNRKVFFVEGGLSSFSNYIAEDYFIGKSFFDRSVENCLVWSILICITCFPLQSIQNICIVKYFRKKYNFSAIKISGKLSSSWQTKIGCLFFIRDCLFCCHVVAATLYLSKSLILVIRNHLYPII